MTTVILTQIIDSGAPVIVQDQQNPYYDFNINPLYSGQTGVLQASIQDADPNVIYYCSYTDPITLATKTDYIYGGTPISINYDERSNYAAGPLFFNVLTGSGGSAVKTVGLVFVPPTSRQLLPSYDNETIVLYENVNSILPQNTLDFTLTNSFKITLVAAGNLSGAGSSQISVFMPRKIFTSSDNSGPKIRGFGGTPGYANQPRFITLQNDGDSVELMWDSLNSIWQVIAKSIYTSPAFKMQYVKI